jgi:DNA-binding LytR/AlgR family response regulator
MRIVIIEDEAPAAARLAKLVKKINDEVDICGRFDSVESSVRFFSTQTAVDLVFMDIQLADGLSFDIFTRTTVSAPVIFTTAFDQYTLKAFKVNSIDYLLKPIDENELSQAVAKYQTYFQRPETDLAGKLSSLLHDINTTRHRERILIKRGSQLSYLKTDSIAYCYADGKLCYAVDFSNNKHLLEVNLTQLEQELSPTKFCRINRGLLVNIDSVRKVHTWLGGRLKLELTLPLSEDTIVSRERVNGFKEWLGQ